MAATMATMNVAAASSAVAAVASAPAVKASPSTVSLGSFRGQRLVAGRGASVAARRSVVVRAEDVSTVLESQHSLHYVYCHVVLMVDGRC